LTWENFVVRNLLHRLFRIGPASFTIDLFVLLP